jgi:hypothetical protein
MGLNSGFKGLKLELNIIHHIHLYGMGWDSSVGIVTHYGLKVLGLNPGKGERFCNHPDEPWCPPSFQYNGYQVIPGSKVTGAWH